jgi:CheY-like chemotaxis protein
MEVHQHATKQSRDYTFVGEGRKGLLKVLIRDSPHAAHGGAIVLPNLPASLCRRVLIVDQSKDSREVITAALQRRGVQTLEASGARQGAELARQHHPQVIVLDLEADAADDGQVQAEYDAESRDHDARLVVLGRAGRYEQTLPKDRILPKPYHYAPLIRTIERLLGFSSEP